MGIIRLCGNKESLPVDQSAEPAPLVNHSDQAVVVLPSTWETEASGYFVYLGYTILIQSKRETKTRCMVHTFNPSTWESHALNPSTRKVETGRDMAGRREEYKTGEDRS